MKYFFAICYLLFALCAFAQTKKTIYIADHSVMCAKGECLQIRLNKKEVWKVIDDTVIGLAYEEGYEYRAKVVVSSSNNYSLVKLISKKKTAYNPAVKLEGKKWVLVSMYDNHNTMSLGDSTIFITIEVANNRVTGHGVCNKLKGTVKAQGHTLAFSELTYTKMKCIDQGNIMEKIVSNLLENSITYHLERGKLSFYSAQGSNMVFVEK